MTATRDFDPRAVVRAVPSTIERDDWETPPLLFRTQHERHRFTVDVAANKLNALLPRYFDRELDGLKANWLGERVWMHPPHAQAAAWAEKAVHEARKGVLVIGLMPVRTEQTWWRDAVLSRATVRFLTGKLDWRLMRLPIEAAVGRRMIDAPRGAFAIVEWWR